MRVFVTGASGAIGTRLVAQLVGRGDEVIGTHRAPESAADLRRAGAEPVALDLLDREAVREAVLEAQPDAIVHEATALARTSFSRNLDSTFAETNRLRTEGTEMLLAAAREAGVPRLVAQSYANLRYARDRTMIKDERDPLDAAPVSGMQETAAAMAFLDAQVTASGHTALRYGAFYGADNDGLVEPVIKRQLPIAGDGGGFTSFVHVDDAATATVLALDHEGPAIYNIVDDDPAPMRDWLPVLADALRARPPRRVPVWMARLFAGKVGVVMATEGRGASNARAKRELGWTLRHPSWRQGFFKAYGPASTRRFEAA
jgi:nucleoside-diphosphate-sugar epimerase